MKPARSIREYNELDRTLIDLAKDIKPLYYLTPINDDAEKVKFFSNSQYVPNFKYRKLEYDASLVEGRLKSIRVPDDVLGTIFAHRKKEILLMNEMMMNRDDKEFIKKASSSIYGTPSKKLVVLAKKILAKIPASELKKDVSATKVKKALKDALGDDNLTDWTIEYSSKRWTTVYPAEKKITICKTRKFASIDPKRLGVHEVGVHALRAANGHAQPLKIFATGLPGYLSTEEGLASYLEHKTGNTSPELMRDYAGRVIAVDSLCNGLSFRECFKILTKNYDLSDEHAWNLTVRAYRGGGYVKDHVYLEGYYKIKAFADTGGDLRMLYVGKFGIEDLPLVRELLDEGILKKPEHLPSFLQESV